LAEKQERNQITNINKQIDKLKEQITEANVQIKKRIEERNYLHEQVRKARDEINQLKAERDSLNQRVKLLKQQRDAVRANETPIMNEISLLKEKIKEAEKKLPRASQRELQEELDAIEWTIQTTSLDLGDEKRLIEDVKALEIQLSGYRKIDRQYKKINELLARRKIFQTQADVYHQELTDLAKKSQSIHTIIMQKTSVMKNNKAEADNLHQAFIKAKEQNNLLYAQIRQLVDQTTDLRTEMKKEDQAKRKEEEERRRVEQVQRAAKEQEIKENISSEARTKLQRGEKLSWDEFQLLMSDGGENETETQD
jgi:uncharacterized coiled-coil DUF342 family protein